MTAFYAFVIAFPQGRARAAVLEKIGKYEIRLQVGRGAMGVVYEGFDPAIGRRVAIKTLRTEMFEPHQLPEVLARFKREAQSAGRLSHPHIVTIHEYGEHDGAAYIVMEYISGKELGHELERGVRYSLEDVVRLMTQLLGALAHAHENGVVHRDLKPANMFVLKDGSLKVVDFGIAHIEASDLTGTGAMLGTPAYMSPEQIMTLPVDHRSDLFSAGVILYQLLTGDKPFTGSIPTIMQKVLRQDPIEPSALNPTISKAWDAVISRAMAKKPEARYQTALQFAEAIKLAHQSERTHEEDGRRRTAEVDEHARREAEERSKREARQREKLARLEIERKKHEDWIEDVRRKAKEEAQRKADKTVAQAPSPPPASRKPLFMALSIAAALAVIGAVLYHRDDSAQRAATAEAARSAEERARLQAERVGKAAEERAAEALRKADEAKRETERMAQAQTEERARLESERMKKESEEKVKAEALRKEDDAKRKTELAAKLVADLQAKKDTAAKAKQEAEEKAKAEAARKAEKANRQARKPGEVFRDCPDCPQMVVIPAGEFTMGSPASEAGRDADEGPQHAVKIAQPFAMGRSEVTVAEFRRFVIDADYKTEAERDVGQRGCFGFETDLTTKKPDWQSGKTWRNPGFDQPGHHPVVCVSWNDAKEYLRWFSHKAGRIYRLPTEAEWEYAARAGTTSARFWGEEPSQACRFANVADQSKSPSGWTFGQKHECNDGHYFTAPVASYSPNKFGLYDVLGNAWEWTEDCWNASYAGAPGDGSAWLSGDCSRRVFRGGGWVDFFPHYVRSANRGRFGPTFRSVNAGFRLARTLE